MIVARIRALEEQEFATQLHTEDSTRMKSDRYSWHYRPSHHIATGLITEGDIALLSQPGKRLLSVGAHPGYLERLLCKLGIPADNILISDNAADFLEEEHSLEKISFDMLGIWPEIGSFDRIIFPESLCIALSDHIKKMHPKAESPFATDTMEAELLSGVLRQALERLRPDGEIRSNGPQSHPNVVKAVRAKLDADGYSHTLTYQRYFLSVRR